MKHIVFAIVIMLGFLTSTSIEADQTIPKHPITKPAPSDQSLQYVTQKEYFDLLRVVLDTAKENNEHLKTLITVGAAGLALVVAIFAIFGFRELRTFLNPLKEKLQKLENDYSEKSASLATTLENKIHRDIQAVIKTGYALNLIEMTKRSDTHPMNEAQKKATLTQAISHLDKALNKDSPEDPTLIAWIQGHRSYALKRLGRLPEAYVAATSAYECKKKLNENGGTPAFNAACYANLQGNTDDALNWLAIAITEDGHNIKDAWDDEDFSSIRANPRFKELVGCKTGT